MRVGTAPHHFAGVGHPGEKDNFVPRSHGETYVVLIPNCRELKILPGTGHSVIVEKPDETAKLVVDFLGA